MECAICFESLTTEAFSTICGHIFCDCINMSSFGRCPTCSQPLSKSDIHKVYFPFASNDGRDNMNDAIVRTLADDMKTLEQKTVAKSTEIQEMLENLQLTFSQSDANYDAVIAENKKLTKEIQILQSKMKSFEDALKTLIADRDIDSSLGSLFAETVTV